MINSTSLEIFDNNQYQHFCSAAQLEKDLNILKGIMMGIASDNIINTQEINLVTNWINAVKHYENNFPYKIFVSNLKEIIQDNIITKEEEQNIIWLCNQYLNKDNPYYNIITSATQTLTGILNGITADAIINEAEIDFLNSWLDDNLILRNTWLFDSLYELVKEIIYTKELTSNNLHQILTIADNIGPDNGSIDNSTFINNIKLDSQNHEISIEGMTFCITGNSLYNSRKDIIQLIENYGGQVTNSVSSKTDYLLICDEKNTCWAYSSYGRKVEKALDLKKKGKGKVEILYEIDFYKHIEYLDSPENKLHEVAKSLAIKYSDENDIPARLKNGIIKKANNTETEQRFKQNVSDWKQIIEKVFQHLDENLAWRFVLLKPYFDEKHTSVTMNDDFLKVTDYFIFRRSNDIDDKELGYLSMLHTSFQKEIEKQLKSNL